MNKSKSFCALVLGLMLAPVSAVAGNVTVTVSNNSDVQRQELVEIPVGDVYARLGIKEGGAFIVKNALGQQVAYQITYDGKLLIDASVRPNGTGTCGRHRMGERSHGIQGVWPGLATYR